MNDKLEGTPVQPHIPRWWTSALKSREASSLTNQIISNHIESSAFLGLAFMAFICIHAFYPPCFSQVSPGSWSRSLRIRWRACARPSGAQSLMPRCLRWLCSSRDQCGSVKLLRTESRFAPSSWIRVPCWTAHDHDLGHFWRIIESMSVEVC